jgi:hypothetical protein
MEKNEKKLTNKKTEEKKIVVMPEKIDGAYVNVEFNKDQLKQLLIEAGLEGRSASGQATVLWKQANPWTSKMLIGHYASSKSKIKASLMALLGADDETIEESKTKKGHDTGSLIENIKLGLAILPELDAKLKTLEGSGKPLWDRIVKSQQTKYLRMAGKDEITEGELKCLIINSPTSKYGIPAVLGEEYGNASLQDVNMMIKKARG